MGGQSWRQSSTQFWQKRPSHANQAALIGMKFADEAIKNRANASVELDLELVGIDRLSGRKGGTAPGHDWSSPSRRGRPCRHNISVGVFRQSASAQIAGQPSQEPL